MPGSLLLCVLLCAEAPLPDSPRVTPIVRLVRQVEPSVVTLVLTDTKGRPTGTGTGIVIHQDGFILTNHHVASDDAGFFVISNEEPRPFRVIGRLPEKDLAIVRAKVNSHLPTLPIGRSEDAMTGEPVLVAGSPGGRGISFTAGILSSPHFFFADGPSAVRMSVYLKSRRERFLQFDAASNKGNSGGPLVNMEGSLIGVVSRLVANEQNVGLAIPVDCVRCCFERIVDPEVRGGFSAGVRIDPLAADAVVSGVESSSPAANSGLRVGDVITAVNGERIRHAMDWWLALVGRSASDVLELAVKRENSPLVLNLQLKAMPVQPAAKVEKPVPGLNYRLFQGQFDEVPNFARMKAQREGVVTSIDLDKIRGNLKYDFGVELWGYLKIPKDGLYRLAMESDDGSLLYVDGNLAIDNDGSHPAQRESRRLRLAQGLHAIRIGYFQGIGQLALALFIDTGEGDKPVTGDQLFRCVESAP
jgi:S1-C subfamily serine protease